MRGGFIKLWRVLADSAVMGHPNALALFVFILLKARWKKDQTITTRGIVVPLERGECLVSRFKTADKLNISERSYRTAFDILVELKMITHKTTSDFTVVRVVNYDKYQGEGDDSDQPATSPRPARDQPASTIKEREEGKERKKRDAIPVPESLSKPELQIALRTYYPAFDPRHPRFRTLSAEVVKIAQQLWEADHGKPYEPLADFDQRQYLKENPRD